LSTEALRYLDKSTRLNLIIQANDELKSSHFVILDDSDFHLHSFKFNDKVQAIRANTHGSDISFYDKVVSALRYANA
jgi:predicted phosphatase